MGKLKMSAASVSDSKRGERIKTPAAAISSAEGGTWTRFHKSF